LFVCFLCFGGSQPFQNLKQCQTITEWPQHETEYHSVFIFSYTDISRLSLSLSIYIYIISAIIPSSDQTLDIQTPPEKVLSTWTQKTYLKHPSSAGIWMFRDIQNLSHTHPTMYPSRNLLSEGHGTTRQG